METKSIRKGLYHHINPTDNEEIIACINVIDPLAITMNRSCIFFYFGHNPSSIKPWIESVSMDTSYHRTNTMKIVVLSFIISS